MNQADKRAFDPASADCLEAVSACLFCGSERHELAFDNVADHFFGQIAGGFDFVRCADCGSLWLPERLTEEYIGEAYRQYYTHDDCHGDTFAGLKGRLRRAHLNARFGANVRAADRVLDIAYGAVSRSPEQLEVLLRFVPKAPAQVLDYGCGSGEFLRLLQPMGHAITGLDLDPQAVAKVRELGIECHTPHDATALGWAGRFDAIALSHVIEHVYDPAGLIGQLASWLKPGGSLFIEAPNAHAEGLAIFGKYWRGLETPRHLSIPSKAGIEIALAQGGFEIERRMVRKGVRDWVWEASLDAIPAGERGAARAAMAAAPPETLANAEFITLVVRKPAS